MFRQLFLALWWTQIIPVLGTITLTANGTSVDINDQVLLTCIDTEKVDIDLYFNTTQFRGKCELFGSTCPVADQLLYLNTIDQSDANQNTMTFTILSFSASDCGKYTCQKNTDASVKSSTTVEHKLSYGDDCSTCGKCNPTTLTCREKRCQCKEGYKYENNVCSPPTTTTTTMPTTTAIETTTEGSSELSSTKPSSVLPTTSSPNASNEWTVIILVASVVGGVVLVGLVVFLVGLFLYRAKRSGHGHGHGKHNHNHNRNTRQRQSGGSYVNSGSNNSQNMEMNPSMASCMDTRHGYPYFTKGDPDRHLGVSVPKQSEQRYEESQMRNTNYVNSKYSVYPGSANTPNFSPQHYHRYGERQRPATTGNIHPGYVYPTYQSGYPNNQTGDYSDN